MCDTIVSHNDYMSEIKVEEDEKVDPKVNIACALISFESNTRDNPYGGNSLGEGKMFDGLRRFMARGFQAVKLKSKKKKKKVLEEDIDEEFDDYFTEKKKKKKKKKSHISKISNEENLKSSKKHKSSKDDIKEKKHKKHTLKDSSDISR